MCYRILRLSLLNVRYYSFHHGFLDHKIRQTLKSILVIFLNKWQIYEEQKRQREEDEGCLFKFKIKSHGLNLSEEEERNLAVSKAFPSYDVEFEDVMSSDHLNDKVDRTQAENEPSRCLPESEVELFVANMEDFSEFRRIHEEMFCRLPSSLEVSFPFKDSCISNPVDSLYQEAFEWGYQTAALVKAITPCRFFLAIVNCLRRIRFFFFIMLLKVHMK